MADITFFYCLTEDISKKVHNLDADDLRVCLTNSIPAQTDTQKADIAVLPSTGGYADQPANAATSVDGSLLTLAGQQITFSASGGTIGPFKYLVLFNETAAGDPLICYWVLDSPITLNDGESYRFRFNNSDPGTIFTLNVTGG